MEAKFYRAEKYVNKDLGYTLHINYSFEEEFELHYHDYYEFFLTTEGEVVQVINDKRQLLPIHSLVFVRPGDVHTYINEWKFSFVNITFTKETMESLCIYFGDVLENMLKRDMPPVVVLKNDDYIRIEGKINSLNTIDLNDKKKKTLTMKIILTEIFAFFMESYEEKNRTSLPDWFCTLVTHLQRSENFNMSLTDMAEFSSRSREHISRLFKKYYGITAADFMNENKLNYCANLLMNTNLSVIDICYECGFQNLSWFYRKFREKYSVTPIEFRKKHKIN